MSYGGIALIQELMAEATNCLPQIPATQLSAVQVHTRAQISGTASKGCSGRPLVSRIGGDEFAVLLPPVSLRSATEITVPSLVGNLLCPVPWDGESLPLCVSAGLAFASEHAGLEPQELFTAADRVLYNAKEDAFNFLICT